MQKTWKGNENAIWWCTKPHLFCLTIMTISEEKSVRRALERSSNCWGKKLVKVSLSLYKTSWGFGHGRNVLIHCYSTFSCRVCVMYQQIKPAASLRCDIWVRLSTTGQHTVQYCFPLVTERTSENRPVSWHLCLLYCYCFSRDFLEIRCYS